MKEPEHAWFLVGYKSAEQTLICFDMCMSSAHPELATEHEPRALAYLKSRYLKEREPEDSDLEGCRLHACRFTSWDGESLADAEKERKRWRGEFRRFLARCGLTLVEQRDFMEGFAENLLITIREIDGQEADMRPLSQSLWGKRQ